jgi:hypothetical protein
MGNEARNSTPPEATIGSVDLGSSEREHHLRPPTLARTSPAEHQTSLCVGGPFPLRLCSGRPGFSTATILVSVPPGHPTSTWRAHLRWSTAPPPPAQLRLLWPLPLFLASFCRPPHLARRIASFDRQPDVLLPPTAGPSSGMHHARPTMDNSAGQAAAA